MSAGQAARAATYTWDASGNGSSFDGAGTWGLTGSNWWTGTSDQVWPNTTDTAVFGAGVSAANPYTVTLSNGGSAINAGGLVFQNQAYTLTGDPLALTGPTPTVTVNAVGATIGSAIAGSAGLVKAGTGLLDISGQNTYAGNTTITGGTLELAAGGTINNAGQIIVGGRGGAAFNLSGGAVTTSNSGNALYVGQNSGQPGAVNISGGSLTITGTSVSAIALGDNGNGTYNQTGGVVNVAGGFRMCNDPPSTAVASITGGSLTTTGGIILAYGGAGQITGGTGTMTIGGSAAVTTRYLAMAGYGGNTSSSAGLGTLNLNGGTLTTHSVSQNVNPFNFIPQSLWGTGVFNFNGGVLQASTIDPSQGTFMGGLSAAYVQAGGANISTNYPFDTISQALVHDPNLTTTDGGLTKTGSGTLILSGANAFNGPTTVNSGSLTVGNALALQNSTVNSSGGGAISFSATTTSATFGGLTGSGNLSGSSGTLSIGNNGTSTTYSGALGGSGALVKLGNGMLTLAGANTYSGSNGTTLSGGTLAADFSQPGAPAANILPSGTPVTFNQGTLAFIGSSGATNSQTLGNLTFNGVANVTLTPNGAAGLAVSAGNTWTRNSGSAVNFALGAPSPPARP
jgi:fibronectin-binding autotransporter adhesin